MAEVFQVWIYITLPQILSEKGDNDYITIIFGPCLYLFYQAVKQFLLDYLTTKIIK